MVRPFYEECANHAFRFYVRYPVINANGISDPEHDMWNACDEVMRNLNDKEREIIVEVFRSKECKVMSACVKHVAAKLQCPQNTVWELLNRAAKEFAKARGLI